MATKDYSSKQENMIADYLGWKVVSGSGARMNPGDIVSDDWLGECKTHMCSKEVSFKYATWRKICKEAMSQFKRPVYFSDDGTQSIMHTFVMFDAPIDEDTCTDTDVISVKKNIVLKDPKRLNNRIFKAIIDDKIVYICSLVKFSEIFI